MTNNKESVIHIIMIIGPLWGESVGLWRILRKKDQ